MNKLKVPNVILNLFQNRINERPCDPETNSGRRTSLINGGLIFKKTHKPAQQLIEFLLIAPFMVIILGVLTEYAYALNINMTLTDGLKTATASIYQEIKPNMSADAIRTLVRTNLIGYLSANNVPTREENTITVSYVTVDNTNAVFVASYKYIPAFTLPNIYFHILPDEFNFVATSLIPAAFLQGNSVYDKTLTSLKLDSIWKGSNFSGLDTYNGVKNGVMNYPNSGFSGITDKMAFLVPVTTIWGTNAKTYAIVSWSGTMVKTQGYDIVNTTDNKIHACDNSTGACTELEGIKAYLDSKGYNNVIFVHDIAITASTIETLQANLNTQWIYKSGSSIAEEDGALKRALALVDTNTFSLGNYDNIDVSQYNPGISSGNTYTVKTIGSRVFVYDPSQDDYTQIK